MKTYVFLATGFEIAEAMLPIDILKRARIEVQIVSITDKLIVKSSCGVEVVADSLLKDIDATDGDMIFLPGGMPGSLNLDACISLKEIIIRHNEAGKWLAAVCAAPFIYGRLGLLKGLKATCYPGFEKDLIGAEFVKETCVCDRNIITACGAGAGYALGRQMVSVLVGEDTANAVLRQMMYQVYA